jgi:hypothetical protein
VLPFSDYTAAAGHLGGADRGIVRLKPAPTTTEADESGTFSVAIPTARRRPARHAPMPGVSARAEPGHSLQWAGLRSTPNSQDANS